MCSATSYPVAQRPAYNHYRGSGASRSRKEVDSLLMGWRRSYSGHPSFCSVLMIWSMRLRTVLENDREARLGTLQPLLPKYLLARGWSKQKLAFL
jgi:hypothetical protein